METFLFSLNVVFPLFLLIALGYFLARIKLVNTTFTKTPNNVCFKVFLPLLLFMNIYNADFSKTFDLQFILLVLGFVAVQVILLFIIVPLIVKQNARRGVVIQALFRGNFLIFGVPVCQTIFGDEGGALAAVVAAFLVPLYNLLAVVTLSVYDSESKINIKQTLIKIITNPLIIGAALGLIFSAFQIPLPECIETPVTELKGIATPFALMLLGCDFSFRSAFHNLKYVLTVSALRLLAVPVVVLSICIAMGIRDAQLAVLMVTFGAPVAVSSYTMACNSNSDYELAGQLVVSTSLLSIFTMFLLVYCTKLLGFI